MGWISRAFVFVAIGFFMGSAWAEPKDLTGLWQFNGQVAGGFKIESGMVRARTQAEKQKLEELKAQGFECVYAHSQIYRCKKISDLYEVLPHHLEHILEVFSGRYFDILRPTGTPSEITAGDTSIQWSIPSVVTTENGKTPSFIYWELNGLDKLHIDIEGKSQWLNVVEPLALAELYLITENAGTLQSQYFYQVLFQR